MIGIEVQVSKEQVSSPPALITLKINLNVHCKSRIGTHLCSTNFVQCGHNRPNGQVLYCKFLLFYELSSFVWLEKAKGENVLSKVAKFDTSNLTHPFRFKEEFAVRGTVGD